MALSVKYQHGRLSKGKNIRVLTLDPARELDAPVQCSLREQCIEDLEPGAGQYEALSYIWGSPTGDQPITCEGDASHYAQLSRGSPELTVYE